MYWDDGDNESGEPRWNRPESAVELEDLVAALHAADDPDEAALDIGTGWLEALLHGETGQELWPRVDELARADPVFRRALSLSWAFSPDAPAEHKPLMWELGELQSASVNFITYPTVIGQTEPCQYRALKVDSPLSGLELARLLREIADDVEEVARRDEQTRADWPELHGDLPVSVAVRWLKRTAEDVAAGRSEDAGWEGWGDAAWIGAAVERGDLPDGPMSPAHHADLLRLALGHLGRSLFSADVVAALTLRIGHLADRLVAEHPDQVAAFDGWGTEEMFDALVAEAAGDPGDSPTWWSVEARLTRIRAKGSLRQPPDHPPKPDQG